MTKTKKQKAAAKAKGARQPRPQSQRQQARPAGASTRWKAVPRQGGQRPVPPPRARRGGGGRGGLCPETCAYAMALVDPRSAPPTASTAVSSSERMFANKAFARGTFSTGTNGFGFVMVDPYAPINNYPVNDASSPIHATTATYPGVVTNVSAPSTQLVGMNHNGIFNALDVSSGAITGYVPVACGLRVKNITPLLNQGGATVAVREPDNESLNGYSFADLLAIESSVEASAVASNAASDWVETFFLPQRATRQVIIGFTTNVPPVQVVQTVGEFDYADIAIPAPGQGIEPSLIVACQAPGTLAAGYQTQTFIFEVWWHNQYNGESPLCSMKTRMDPVGNAALRNAAAELTTSVIDGFADEAAIAFVDLAADLLSGAVRRGGRGIVRGGLAALRAFGAN